MLGFKKPKTRLHINPKFRAYGKARIDIAQRASESGDWEKLWKKPIHPFPFKWGEPWKQCIEYKVDDFAAEAGFWIDMMGVPVNAFDPDYAMFTSPKGEFYFAILAAQEYERSTPADALRIQFMVEDIHRTTEELQRRGIVFDQLPKPCVDGSNLWIGSFRSPHGICIELWGFIPVEEGSSNLRESEGSIPEERIRTVNSQKDDPDAAIDSIEGLNNKVERGNGTLSEDSEIENMGSEESNEDETDNVEVDIEYEYVYEDEA